MNWQTATPAPPMPFVIDPHAGRPTLIGSHWHRRTPEDDPYDDIVIRGVFDLGNDSGGLELVISPQTFGPTLTCTPESLGESYARSQGQDPTERLRQRLRELEARP